MRLDRSRTTLLFALLFLLATLAAGCGGGGNQLESGQGGDRNGDRGATSGEQGGEAAGQEEGPERKIALGSIQNVNAGKKRLSLKPSSEAQSRDPIPFKVAPNARITLDGERAELADVEKGQQAQIEYIVRGELGVPNRAVVIELFSTGGSESTG
ncbi:MAG: hypothetical protein AB1425_04355 [Actinomycetota bacterium]